MSSIKVWIMFPALLVLAACSGPVTQPKETPASPAVAVQVAAAAEVAWPETFEASGTVRARTTAMIASRAMGYIRDVRPHEGDRVQTGDVVVTIEARETQVAEQQARIGVSEARSGVPEADSAVQSAQAQLELAEITLRRMQELLNKRSVSQQEFDEADARAKVARQALNMAGARRKQLDEKIRQAEQAVTAAGVQTGYLEVRAPFAGRVTSRRAEPGTLASPGLPLLEIESENGYRLEVAVPEAQLHAVRQGQSMTVLLGESSGALTGRVDEIVPSIDSASRSFIVKVSLPARPEIRSGLFGRAVFATGNRTALTIPTAAVAEQGQLRNVLVADNSVAQLRLIRVGEERGGQVEVLSGLVAGDRVISPRPAGLADGQRVEVAP